MKRYGEKELRKALVNGATIRENDWYCLDAGYRVMIDGEVAGYIIFDLFLKLKNDGTIEQSSYGYSYREYAASDYAMEQAAEANPFGLAACMASIKFERDELHMDAAEILAHLYASQEKQGCFFNTTMFRAFRVVFPGFPVSDEVAREYWCVASISEETDDEKIAHFLRLVANDQEPETEEETATQETEEEETTTTENEEEPETMSREERRAAIRAIEENRDHLVSIHQANTSPAETVAELIGRIGYEAARKTIAEAVNARGSWDERISARTRAWAATITSAASADFLRDHYLTTDAIHPAHVEQIATAAAEFDREKPENVEAYDVRRLRYRLLRAISRDDQSRALDACLDAHEAARMHVIREEQRAALGRIYDAWERGWVALEEAQAAQAEHDRQVIAHGDAHKCPECGSVYRHDDFCRVNPGTLVCPDCLEDIEPEELEWIAPEAAQEPQEEPEPEPVEEPAEPEEVAQEAQEAPDYLRESWPTSNRVESVYYFIISNSPGRVCSAFHYAETVDELQTYVQQLKHDGETIVGAWRHDRTTGERREFIPETRQEQTDRENWEYCRRIAEELEVYADGSGYKCPDCGEVLAWDNDRYDDDENRYTCPHCGESVDADDLEVMNLYDYFGDALDVEYRAGSDKEYRSVRVMVTCGGPNVYIDTASRAVELYWGTDRASYLLDWDVCDAIDDWAREYWDCL